MTGFGTNAMFEHAAYLHSVNVENWTMNIYDTNLLGYNMCDKLFSQI